MMTKRIYIACPISKGDMLTNVRQADAAFLALRRAGFAPLNPVWSVFCGSAELNGLNPVRVVATADPLPVGTTHADWIALALPWVEVAHAVLRLPGESVGADREVAYARSGGIPVYDSVEELVTVEGGGA